MFVVRVPAVLHPHWLMAAHTENPTVAFRADAIIANPVSYGHVHVAEYLDVPLHLMFPQPWTPTTAFPHPLSSVRLCVIIACRLACYGPT